MPTLMPNSVTIAVPGQRDSGAHRSLADTEDHAAVYSPLVRARAHLPPGHANLRHPGLMSLASSERWSFGLTSQPPQYSRR